MKKFFSAWWPPLIYMGGIFSLSAQSRLPEPPGPWILSWDKAQHCTAYFILGLLIIRSARRFPAWKGMPAPLQAVLMGALYGTLDEVHQYFVPGRSTDPFDLMADITGLVLAAAAATLFTHIQTLRRDKDVRKPGRKSIRGR
jgi:VanZ family protein